MPWGLCKGEDSGWDPVSRWGWSMAMVPLKRKKTPAERVRMSRRGWSIAMGPLKRKRILAGRVRMSKWG